MKTNTVLFDLDGTLLDTNGVVVKSFQYVYKTLGVEPKSPEEIMAFFGEPIKTTLEREFEAPYEETVKIYRDYHYEIFYDSIDVFPGMLELIQSLHKDGYKLGVVTSRLIRTTMEGLKKYGLDEYFQCIITASDTTKHKPDPEPIQMALDALASKSDETIMIGDSIFDIECAKNAGVKSVLVDWSVTKDEVKNKMLPDYEVMAANDIKKIIEKMNK